MHDVHSRLAEVSDQLDQVLAIVERYERALETAWPFLKALIPDQYEDDLLRIWKVLQGVEAALPEILDAVEEATE